MNKKVFIADILSHTFNGISTGHYFAVARNYQNIFGEDVIIAGGPVYAKSFNREHLLELPYNVDGGGSIKSRLMTFANARKLFKVAKEEVIVLQQCSTITTFLCIALFYHCKSKLYMIQYNCEGLRNIIGKLLFKLAKRKLNGIICPNKMVGNIYNLPYCVVPDYVYTGTADHKFKPLIDRQYDFCVIGRIAPEKGVLEVAQWFANKHWKILIAGKPQSEVLANTLKDICSHTSNIDLFLGYISDEQYFNYLHNSKFAILNYSSEYSQRSSGVVFDMLFNGVPVVGKDCMALKFIEEEGLGIVYDKIEDINFDTIMQQSYYDQTLYNIKRYCISMQNYINRLKEFIQS